MDGFGGTGEGALYSKGDGSAPSAPGAPVGKSTYEQWFGGANAWGQAGPVAAVAPQEAPPVPDYATAVQQAEAAAVKAPVAQPYQASPAQPYPIQPQQQLGNIGQVSGDPGAPSAIGALFRKLFVPVAVVALVGGLGWWWWTSGTSKSSAVNSKWKSKRHKRARKERLARMERLALDDGADDNED